MQFTVRGKISGDRLSLAWNDGTLSGDAAAIATFEGAMQVVGSDAPPMYPQRRVADVQNVADPVVAFAVMRDYVFDTIDDYDGDELPFYRDDADEFTYDVIRSESPAGNTGENAADKSYAPEFAFLLGLKSTETKIARALVKAAHQQQYLRMERRMQRAMVPFFQKAVRSIVAGITSGFDGWISDEDYSPKGRELGNVENLINEAFDQEKLDKLLAEAAAQPLADGFVEGAQAERILVRAAMRRRRLLEQHAGKSTASDYLGDLDPEDLYDDLDFATELPEWLRDEAQNFILRSFREPYWTRINQTTRDDIMGTLWRAIEDGLSIVEIRNRIMEHHGSAYSKARATNVARTEMTGAMSAGHVESIRRAYEDIPGIEPAKEWLSVMSNTTRDEHAEADGQQVPLDDDFTVGGEACLHPGDPRLSPAMRCNCMCAIISAFVGEGLEDGEVAAEETT